MPDYLSLEDESFALVVCLDSNRWDFRSRGMSSKYSMETNTGTACVLQCI